MCCVCVGRRCRGCGCCCYGLWVVVEVVAVECDVAATVDVAITVVALLRLCFYVDVDVVALVV